MKREIRTVVFDEELHIEAYRFEGFVRPFPSHFHEYYVIGYIESGQRTLSCNDQECAIRPGHILVFNPGDSHACVQSDGGTLDYRGFNISKEVILGLMEALDSQQELPVFSPNVIFDSETASCLRTLHDLVLSGFPGPWQGRTAPAAWNAAGPEIRAAPPPPCSPVRGGGPTGVHLYRGKSWRAHLPGSALPLCRAEPVHPSPGIYQIEGGHTLPLSGKYPCGSGRKAAGTRSIPRRSRLTDRVFGPEPLYQLLRPLHRPVPRRLPEYV